MPRSVRAISLLAGGHLLLIGLVLLLLISQINPDGDSTPGDRQVGDAAGRALMILVEPAASLDGALKLGRRYGDGASWALQPVNSLLWGTVLYLGPRLVRRRT